MSRLRLLIAACVGLLLLLVAVGVGAWWYLFGPNQIDSAELVPANTIFFASIPNAAALIDGYQSSKAKTLADDPNAKPIQDTLAGLIGKKNINVFLALLPNLSGQSFIALTHFDYEHPEKAGLIAAMKPKAGFGNFANFVATLKSEWGDEIKKGQTGKGTVSGVDYDWIRGPGAPDKICVAQVGGWIVTSWGEMPLQDWLERFHHRSTTSSLAHDANFLKTITRVGDNPMTLAYVNLQEIAQITARQIAKDDPTRADYLAKKLQALGGAAAAMRFENGQMVDRYSVVFPRPAQLDSGMSADACPFDTLKFTGPDTRLYWAASINWKHYYEHLKQQKGPSAYNNTSYNPMANEFMAFLQNWVKGTTLDPHRNIIDALGSEISLQVEWNKDETFPEAGLIVKVDRPDDFKPTIEAIKETVGKTYAATGVLQELTSNGQKFYALQFVQSSALTPTMTETGPYFGVFASENQAVRTFQRNPTLALTQRAEFNAQIGDRRNGAAQIIYFDSPYVLDRAYRTAMPYVSLASLFNKDLAAWVQGKKLPDDLTWLAPMGTWSCIVTPDEEGIQAYSISGIGNQGILLGGALGEATNVLETMGYLPHVYAPPPKPTINKTPDASPSIGNSTVDTNPPLRAVIFITADNKVRFNETPVPQSGLTDFLRAQHVANSNMSVTVRVDKNSTPDILSAVMDAGMTAGFGVLPYAYVTAPGANTPSTPDTNAAPTPPDTNSAITPSTNTDANPQNPGPIHP